MRKCLPILAMTAWLLWSYGYPQPRWEIMGHYATQDACEARAAMMGPAYLMTREPAPAMRCYPVGVDPERVHAYYEWIMALPEAQE